MNCILNKNRLWMFFLKKEFTMIQLKKEKEER